jgi:hypothetical protein
VEAEWGGSFGGGSSGGGFGEAVSWRWIWRRRTLAEALAEVGNRKHQLAVFSIIGIVSISHSKKKIIY